MPRGPKSDPGADIQVSDYFVAQTRWIRFWGDQQRAIPNFGKWLGMSGSFLSTGKGKGIVQIRQSAVRKITMLNGPYWFTLLKAYQIRKERRNASD